MQPLFSSRIRARQIVDSDLSGVSDVLTRGFPRRSSRDWMQALRSLAAHPTPANLPKYGYLLESGDAPVGVILTIWSIVCADVGQPRMTRCNLSSWYVEPAFRSYATMLISLALRHKDVTYLNISPAPNTRPIIEAQGFSKYSGGRFVVPLFPTVFGARGVKVVRAEMSPDAPFESCERDLLLDHTGYGCMGLWCITSTRSYPFVFRLRLAKGVLPCAHLIYCRDIEDFIKLAGPLAVALARRGSAFFLIDSNGPLRGLVGKYFGDMGYRYFKGPAQPRVGDLAYTEAALFGLAV
jgi:hypothetical protein